MTSLTFDVIGHSYPKDQEQSKSFCCQQILLNQLHKRQKYRDMRGRHPSVVDVQKFNTDVGKKRCEWEWNKTIISKNFCVLSFVKTSGYHLKVFVFKLNQIHICQTTIVENHSRRYYVKMNSMSKSKSWQIMVHFARG